MSLSAIVDALIASGGTLEQVAAIVRAHEAQEKPKSAAALRQARYRARNRENGSKQLREWKPIRIDS